MPNNPVLERLQERVNAEQLKYEADPAGYQPPDPRFKVGPDGKLRFVQEDPMTGLQKVFVIASVGAMGALAAAPALAGGGAVAGAAPSAGAGTAGIGAGMGSGIGAGTGAGAAGIGAGMGSGIGGGAGVGAAGIGAGMGSGIGAGAGMGAGAGTGMGAAVGGSAFSWRDLAGMGGRALGSMGAAATQNRGEQDRLNSTRDIARVGAEANFDRALLGRAELELRQRQDQRTAQQDAYKQALRSALAKNMQDVSFDRSGFRTNVPTISFAGGARPSALGAEGRQAAGEMNNRALQQLMNPQAFTPVPAPQRVQFSDPSKASFWEKLAGPLGMGLTVAGEVL